jgi:hypothetical protein
MDVENRREGKKYGERRTEQNEIEKGLHWFKLKLEKWANNLVEWFIISVTGIQMEMVYVKPPAPSLIQHY